MRLEKTLTTFDNNFSAHRLQQLTNGNNSNVPPRIIDTLGKTKNNCGDVMFTVVH
jgi:hypothetical protein